MTVSTLFNTELALVGAQTFTYTLQPTWGENEFAVSGYAVSGGTDYALEHGASEALHALDYRFWTPYKTTRPASLPGGGVTIARGRLAMPYNNVYFNYQTGLVGQKGIDFDRWKALNNMNDTRRPAGHAWGTIINAINAEDAFFTNNPTYIVDHGGNDTFNLDNGVIEAAIVDRVAEYMADNLNAFNRASLDPVDGSQYTTEEVVRFNNAVAALVRVTVPDATFGMYAYAGHRAAPIAECPFLYVQVALGFNNLGIGYQAMVDQWGEKVAEVGLRGYGDIAAQNGWRIGGAGLRTPTYFDGAICHIPNMIASGANGMNMETSGNWLPNIIGQYHGVRYWKTGSSTFAGWHNAIVNAVYGGDEAVYDFYTLFSREKNSEPALRRACALVDAMADEAYKAEFRGYMTFLLQDWYVDSQPIYSGPYFTQLEKNLRWSEGLFTTGEVFGYGYQRQLANSNTTNNGRPDLTFNNNPHWFRYPAVPTEADYDALEAKLSLRVANVPDYISDPELVLVDVMPTGSAGGAGSTPSDTIRTRQAAQFYVKGPVTVTLYFSGPPTSIAEVVVGAGLHELEVSAPAFVKCSGGNLFWRCEPGFFTHYSDYFTEDVAIDNGLTVDDYWAYFPRGVAGRYDVESNTNIRFVDSSGTKNVRTTFGPFTGGTVSPQTILPGMNRVVGSATVGIASFYNICPFLCLNPHVMLMPRAMAEAEFPGRVYLAAGV